VFLPLSPLRALDVLSAVGMFGSELIVSSAEQPQVLGVRAAAFA
jgi:hypothetical protein